MPGFMNGIETVSCSWLHSLVGFHARIYERDQASDVFSQGSVFMECGSKLPHSINDKWAMRAV